VHLQALCRGPCCSTVSDEIEKGIIDLSKGIPANLCKFDFWVGGHIALHGRPGGYRPKAVVGDFVAPGSTQVVGTYHDQVVSGKGGREPLLERLHPCCHSWLSLLQTGALESATDQVNQTNPITSLKALHLLATRSGHVSTPAPTLSVIICKSTDAWAQFTAPLHLMLSDNFRCITGTVKV
jgi:hypothetical protein